MQYCEAKQGRVFVLRLEHGETVHEEVERFAREQGVAAAALIAVGGAGVGSELVVGPKDGDASPIAPMRHVLENVHEITGAGTLFSDDAGNPLVHLHMACGRAETAVAGCIRRGVKVWQIMEIVVFELLGAAARRAEDPALGLKLLAVSP